MISDADFEHTLALPHRERALLNPWAADRPAMASALPELPPMWTATIEARAPLDTPAAAAAEAPSLLHPLARPVTTIHVRRDVGASPAGSDAEAALPIGA